MHRPRCPPTHHDLPAITLRNKYVRFPACASSRGFVHPTVLCMLEDLCFELCMWDPPRVRARGRIAYEAGNLRELLGTPTVAVHGEEDGIGLRRRELVGFNTGIRPDKRWVPIGACRGGCCSCGAGLGRWCWGWDYGFAALGGGPILLVTRTWR